MTRSGETDARSIRRILIALDASSHSIAALDAAIKLAAGLRAEVTGLFVEDIVLLSSAELPITREVGTFSGIARQFDRCDMERHFRAQASAAERDLARRAGHAHVAWSFRVARGAVNDEVIAAAREADLVTVGSQGCSLLGWRGVGSTARAVLSGTRCPVLVTRHGARLDAPVMVVFDGSRSAHTGLDIAIQLARTMEDTIIVLAADDGSGAVESLAEEVVERMDACDVEAHLRRFRPSDPVAIIGVAREMGCGVLVLPADSAWLSGEALHAITRGVHCPVLLARERESVRRARRRRARRLSPAEAEAGSPAP